MVQPEAQRHLYEIHTAPQSDLVSAVLSADHVAELVHLRDFLGKWTRLWGRHDAERTSQGARPAAPQGALRSRTALIEAAIRDAENDIMAHISERLESEPDPLSPASAAAIVRELMHI
jgi:hypothetical protein